WRSRSSPRWEAVSVPTRFPLSSTISRSPWVGGFGLSGIPPRFPQGSTDLSTGTVLDAVDQVVHLLEDDAALGHLAADLLAGVHHGRVVAAPELFGDLRVAVVGELAKDVHADLTGCH